VRFLDLLGLGVPTGDGVLDLWGRRPGPTTEVVLGADASGPVTVDLARQGPHTMLAGATGAGKSILLQTLVTSLLLVNRPDELNLVLVDFKGGGAFLPFERCPHIVGLIRSTGESAADVFDEAAARVLASVRAEVRRRESLLARYGGEIEVYWAERGRNARLPALPRLVMVFDEFARVVESSPDFLRELVNVAAKGRSLGMHLVLATQSLQGKLSPELKNNIDLRITLRQNESADSVEVLGVPDAVTIPGRLRGRGMILCTRDETRTPRVFQSGYLGDPPPGEGAPPARTRLLAWTCLGDPRPRPRERPDPGKQSTDQDLVITAVETAAFRLGLDPPFRPLLPPLPAELPLEDLDTRVTTPIPPDAVPVGLVDDPDAQAQPAAVLDMSGTDRLLVAGGPQSGRTAVAHTVITGIATRFRPDQVHVYVLEHRPAGLAGYADLPHCGAVLSPAEPDRIRRMVTWLDAEVQRRRTARLSPGGPPEPYLVLVVDGWEYLENRGDPTLVETSVLALLRGVVAAGPPVGVHVVALGGAELMTGRLPGLCSRRLLLPFPTEDLRRMYLAPGAVSPPAIPGRAVDAASGRQVQLARPAASPAAVVARAVTRHPARPLPRRFPSMPTRVSLAEVTRGDHPATWIPLGVGGPEVTALGLDLFTTGPHAVLVSGPPGSGRSTALATLAHGLHRIGVGLLVVATPRSPLPGMLPDGDGVRVLTGTRVPDAELRDAAADLGERRIAVLVDDCEQVEVVPAETDFQERPTLLLDAAGPGALGRLAVVLAGDALPIVTGQRRSQLRVVSEIITGGARVLLTPTSPLVARELGFALETDQFLAGPPGRGYLALGRQTHLVQVAVPGAGR
jgi:S-DNA-T family DNA segregation ATPase FtsK/SpoIIIE